MTAALTPDLALDYLHALSADLRAAVVLDAHGRTLAGPPALGEAARENLPEGPTLLEGTDGVFAARDERHTIVAVTGPHALSRLTRHDLRSALATLGGVNPVDATPTLLPAAAVSALLGATEEDFRRPRAV